MTDPRVLVAGAGPAGAHLAERLAARGVPVLLVDRSLPDARTHEWIVDLESSALAEAGLLPLPDGVGAPTARALRVLPPEGAPSNGPVEAPLDGIVSVHLDRFVAWLRDRAVAAGARFQRGARIAGARPAGADRMAVEVVRSADERLEGTQVDYVADCTGGDAVVRRSVDGPGGWHRRARPADRFAAWRAVHPVDPAEVRRVFGDPRVAHDVCVARLGFATGASTESLILDERARTLDLLVGLPADRIAEGSPESRVRALLAQLASAGPRLHGGGGEIPVSGPLVQPVSGRVLALGDAAIQAVPLHGSGVASALLAARLAADALVEALDRGPAALWSYTREFLRRRAGALFAYDMIRRAVRPFSRRDMAAVLGTLVDAHDLRAGMQVRTPEILAGLSRRSPAGVLRAPRLALRFSQAVVQAALVERTARNAPESPSPPFLAALEALVAAARRAL
jgi:flavin-dependent dehydrogenase